jgi:CheY-like chemotaxis protein
MNGILGFADLLNDPQLNITERDSYIQVINKCSKQLLNIITDIVDISKIETNQVQIKLGAVKLSQLMESLYQAFYLKIAGMADLQFEYIMTPDTKDLGIITDEVKLQQILSNLLENAFKYTESGSIRYGCKLVDGEIEFFVSDTGIGIAEADHQVVFDRFRQAENHLVRKHGGVGLGLAICKAYVEMLGGKMRLQSQLYQGTTFIFDIPCRPTDIEVTEHHASGGGSHDFGSRTILVAEDDETNYNYIRAALKSTGVTLIHAWNGEEAIALYQQNPQIELVIMDIRMPLLNGFEATVRLKEIQPQLPILAMTAYAYEDEKQKALQAGCSDYLAKPVSLNILLETLRKYLS